MHIPIEQASRAMRRSVLRSLLLGEGDGGAVVARGDALVLRRVGYVEPAVRVRQRAEPADEQRRVLVKEGFATEDEPDPELGQKVFTQSCLHCHDPAEGAAETYFRDESKSRSELARRFRTNSDSSAYHFIRQGTHPVDEQRLYMPNYTKERLSDFQIESLRAWLEP